MTQDDIPPILRDSVPRLVAAAESVITKAFQHGEANKLKDMKTQMSQLISVCQDASCAEEIANYVRYQIGRDRWRPWFGDSVLTSAADFLSNGGLSSTEHKLWAWRRYAMYLKRALVYQVAVGRQP